MKSSAPEPNHRRGDQTEPLEAQVAPRIRTWSMRVRTLGRALGVAIACATLATGFPRELRGQREASPIAIESNAWARDYLAVGWLRGEAGPSASREPLLLAEVAAQALCGETGAPGACDRFLRGCGAGRSVAVRLAGGAMVGDEGSRTISAGLSLLGENWGIRVAPRLSAGGSEEFSLGHVAAGLRLGQHVALLAGLDGFWFGPGAAAGLARGPADTSGYAAVAVRALRLPRNAGEIDISSSVSRLSAERAGSPRAWWWTTRLTYVPSRSLELGVNRAVVFGGEGSSVLDPSLRRLLFMLIGKHNTEVTDSGAFDFDNQVVSVDALWRLPGLPVGLYAEWGAEDSSGALTAVPGLRVGAQVAWSGRVRGYAGIEGGSLARGADGNPPWYNHGALGAYTDEGRPLGHPLGGHGRELRATVFASEQDARWRARATLFQREREAENARGPLGRSAGGSLRLEVEPHPGLEIVADALFESFERPGIRDEAGVSIGVRYVRGLIGAPEDPR